MTLSAIIPTLNSAHSLPDTLRALEGVDEIVVVDGGSQDQTIAVAKASGARIVAAQAGRGTQMIAGADAAKGDWLLFLHADTVLDAGWRSIATQFTERGDNAQVAGVFKFAVDDASSQARRLERLVAWRVRQFGLPYGDQGLLIHRDFYAALGGFRPLPLMEDVDLIRRIGRHRLTTLDAKARTSAIRWHRGGWIMRSARNIGCLSLYYLGVPPRVLKRLYG